MDGDDQPHLGSRSRFPDDVSDLSFLTYGHEEEVMASVSTQTESHVESLATCYWEPSDSGIDASLSQDDGMDTNTQAWSSGNVFYFFPKMEKLSPVTRQRNGLRRDRTPHKALMMMERHRENERARHHGLNDSLSVICQRVPGSPYDGRETKVVMMQRIISYVAFLENTISSLCSHMNIYTNSVAPLTTQLSKDIESRYLFETGTPDEEEEECPGKRSKLNAKLKLSSPTIDSTSDYLVPEHTIISDHRVPEHTAISEHTINEHTIINERIIDEHSVMNEPIVINEHAAISVHRVPEHTDIGDCSQDSTVPTSSFLPVFNDNALSPWLVSTEEVVDQCEYEPIFCPETNGSEFCLSPEFTSMQCPSGCSRHSSDSVSLFSCPDEEKDEEDKENTRRKFPERYGRGVSLYPDCPHSFPTSPDVFSNLQIPSSSSAFSPPLQSSSQRNLCPPAMPIAMKNKRKQYNPQRTPLSSLGNSSEKWRKVRFEDEDNYIGNPRFEDAENFSLPNLGMTRRQKMELAQLQVHSRPFSSASDRDKDVPTKSGKTDLRKTSWMNGFMMFSRLNRRTFINANPGVHTSNISKMMGQAWRNMSTEEQTPYKEKAKLCAKELQKQQELPECVSVSPQDCYTGDRRVLFQSGSSNAHLS